MRHLLIDSNILVLLLIGRWDPLKIGSFRRTKTFTVADFDLLEATLTEYGRVVTTPGVLTEVSNLIGNAHRMGSGIVVNVCVPFVERTAPKEQVFADRSFGRLGFADCSILAVLDGDTSVLTDDVHLYAEVWERGREAINFNHLRSRGQ